MLGWLLCRHVNVWLIGLHFSARASVCYNERGHSTLHSMFIAFLASCMHSVDMLHHLLPHADQHKGAEAFLFSLPARWSHRSGQQASLRGLLPLQQRQQAVRGTATQCLGDASAKFHSKHDGVEMHVCEGGGGVKRSDI